MRAAAAALVVLGAAPVQAAEGDEAVLRALLKLSAVPLSAAPTCRGAGLSDADRTVGDMLGSIWSQFVGVRQEPPILGVRRKPAARGSEDVEVTFHRLGGQEEWRWGFAFRYDPRNGRPDPKSLRCLTAG